MTLDVLLDMDDVMAGFTPHFWLKTREMGLTWEIGSEDQIRHRFSDRHIPNRRERRLARDLVDSDGFFYDLPVLPGAIEGVELMLGRGWTVTVVSKPLASSVSCASDKYRWLRKHFPALADGAILAPDKVRVRGDILIDDAPPLDHARAGWAPVVFLTAHNTETYQGLPRWRWSDGIDRLVDLHDEYRHP